MLSSAVSLRTVSLNLDFPDDIRLYINNVSQRQRCDNLRNARGWELISIFEACPRLEYVALLTHGMDSSFWGRYRPRRCAEPRYTIGSM